MAYEDANGRVIPKWALPPELRGGIVGSFVLAPGEKLVDCPYDKSHFVLSHKYGNHIVKCRRNYVNSRKQKGLEPIYEQCPNGRTCSPILLPELEKHKETCKPLYDDDTRNRPTVITEEMKLEIKNRQEQKAKKERVFDAMALFDDNSDEDEDWERESRKPGYQKGYDPRIKMARENIFKIPFNLAPKERREFKERHFGPQYKKGQGVKMEQNSGKGTVQTCALKTEDNEVAGNNF